MKTTKTGSTRVLHSAALLRPPSGICTQMDWEQEAANELGIDWQVKMYCPWKSASNFKVLHFDNQISATAIQTSIEKFKAWINLRRNYHQWLLNQQETIDIFLLRYYVHDPFQWQFVRQCKKPVYLVHHTLEIPELALPGGINGFVRSTLEKIIGRASIKKAAGIIGVTQEIADYELARSGTSKQKSHIYPNGIVFRNQILHDRRSTDIPELLFVANFAPWHGLDRLLIAMRHSNAKLKLHLVGKIPDILLPMTQDPRIEAHGNLSHEQIKHLSEQCWIGLASFALDRKKMNQACPLKTREYLMFGLPVYGDYKDIFPENTPYFQTGNENLEEILSFAKKTRTLEKNQIASLAQPSIDKKNLLAELFSSIQ